MKASVLIVDDRRCVRDLVAEELVSEGYEVHAVGEAELLADYLKFSTPDLVLVDPFSDRRDGFDLLGGIKRWKADLPVIVFTAHDSYRRDPRVSQADGYLIKSVILDQLKEKIGQVLRRKASAQEQVEIGRHDPAARYAVVF
jgi:two-component system response regulator GlrR